MHVLARLGARTPLLCCTAAAALTIAACQTTPPDPDGQPGGAKTLQMGALHADQLSCRGGDCADWYRVRVPQRGDLVVLLESPPAAVGGGRDLALTLADGRSRQLERQAVSPVEGDALITWQANPGYYMLRVDSSDEARTPLPYELSLRMVLPPPPPPSEPPPPPEPVYDVVEGQVLEVEGGFGDPEAVLVDRGETDGIFPGQGGRLLNGDATIAAIVVVDTYPEGSRARIEGTLSEPISPSTRVEIDVPTQSGR